MAVFQSIAAALHPMEVKFYHALGNKEEFSEEEAVRFSGLSEQQVRTVIEWQKAKECLSISESQIRIRVEPGELALRYREQTPEERLVEKLKGGPALARELMQDQLFEQAEMGKALGKLRALGIIVQDEQERLVAAPGADLSEIEETRRLLQLVLTKGRLYLDEISEKQQARVQADSRKRGKSHALFRLSEEKTRHLLWTELGRQVWHFLQESGRSAEEVNLLTPEMLADGSWKNKSFRRYDLSIPPPRRHAARKHPYRQFLDGVRRKLLALGFEEMRGQLVEPEFWLMDALFMPQFHSARDIHDVYQVKEPTLCPPIDGQVANRVAAAHESGAGCQSRGWRTPFDHQSSRRLLLRSQGTVLSARWLSRASVPGKYFAIARCFRPDEVDATHAADFFQCEGIVLGQNMNFTTLLGLLKLFAEELARAKEIKFLPAYFPFTEPSVEVHIRHPQVGWMELGGAGVFRPEVTLPQGVTVPVIAWGLGLDRMAMMALGLDDIRELFSPNLSRVRGLRLPTITE